MSQREYLDQVQEVARLETIATHLRIAALDNITKSKAGHPGGSMSIADIITAIYFGRIFDPVRKVWNRIMRYDPQDPLWSSRDRFILSKGHAAPILYATLAEAGFFSKDVLKIYRKIDSPLEGHPAMFRKSINGKPHGTKGVDFSTGSLGHGLAIAAGMALHAKVYGYDYNVFVIAGDGDLQEGMTWESVMTIPNKGLSNVCCFIDYNRLQVDGSTDIINPLDPLDKKMEAFNWDVRVINGHDYYEIIDTLEYFKKTRGNSHKPLMVIANTIKGKGISEIENRYEYHAVPLTMEQFERAERELLAKAENIQKKHASCKADEVEATRPVKSQLEEPVQDFNEIIRKLPAVEYSEPTATRVGYGNALLRLGSYEKIFVFNADLAGACASRQFAEAYPENAPERKNRRSVNVGVQEATMMAMGAALASCEKIPIVNSFAIFSTGRAWEMIRQDISYPRLNVKIVGSHAGAALGEYGVSHQAIEDVGCMRVLPHMTIIEPSDAVQADRMLEKVILYDGPVYYRLGRNPSPLFYSKSNQYGIVPRNNFEIGEGITVRDGKDLTIISSGPILAEALEVADRVKESVRVIDMPTIQPIDTDLIIWAAKETGHIVVIQDHYENCGLNEAVGRVILKNRLVVKFDSVALAGFAESGSRDDLYEKYGLSAHSIIKQLGLTI